MIHRHVTLLVNAAAFSGPFNIRPLKQGGRFRTCLLIHSPRNSTQVRLLGHSNEDETGRKATLAA